MADAPSHDWREQARRYEVFANSRRIHARSDTATELDPEPRPFVWLRLNPDRFDCDSFVARGVSPAAALIESLRDGEATLLPLHWAEAERLRAHDPSLELIEDGVAFATSSPRSLLLSGDRGRWPNRVAGLEDWVIKTHLSQEAYDRFDGRHPGARELPRSEVAIAVVLTHLLTEVTAEEPRFSVQPEALGLVARDRTGALDELGCLFRHLEPSSLVPGFALSSPSTEPLPDGPVPPAPRPMAVELIARMRQHEPTLTFDDAFVAAFVEPLADLFFAFCAQGFGAPLHGQNLLFDFDPTTGRPRRLVVRDMNGFHYCHAYRRAHGLSDLFDAERLRTIFPWYSRADFDAWTEEDGQVQQRFREPDVFQFAFDFYVGSFFFQLLVTLHEQELLDDDGVDDLRERIIDEVHAAAKRRGFDLGRLQQPDSLPRPDRFWPAYFDPYGITDESGDKTRGRILFRRNVRG